MALAEFLNSNLKSFNVSFDFNNNMKCEFITNLSLIAIKDILNTVKVPNNSIVELAYSGKLPSDTPSKTYINKSLKLRLKHLYEISLNLKFTTSSDTSIEVENSVNILPKVSLNLLNVNDIIDAKNLILKLKNNNNPLYAHIRHKFSNFMQNLILCYDTEKTTPSVQFQKMIIDDLNFALLRGDLYDENIFSNIITPKEMEGILTEIINLFNQKDFSKYDISNMIYADSNEHINIIVGGRYLLEKAFPEEIIQEYNGNFY